MRKRKGYFLFSFVSLLLIAATLGAAQKPYQVIGWEDDFYFGHITYLEAIESGHPPLITRESGEKEEVFLNFPIMPGDTILSRDGRVELQFDNGTIVRLDRNTELRVETILAPSLSSSKKLSNLVLAQGAIYVMYKKYDSFELFQILTPETAVKMEHNAVALIQVKGDGGSEIVNHNGRVWLMAPADSEKKNPREMMLEKGWKAVVLPLGETQIGLYKEENEFLAWNKEINENFEAYHEASVLPQPLQKLPPAVFYFAQRYGSTYGEWVWHELYGYVWRPFYNDYYPWGTWQPFYYGRWMNVGGSLFWIPAEPWGWVPYHLGLWMWDKNKGWVWIPGSLFAPAWAVWDFYFGYYAWRPWSLYDWYLGSYFYPFGYNQASGYYYYNFYDQMPQANEAKPILEKIRKDQLKRTASSEKVPIPKELKRITNTAINALQKGDPEAVASLHRALTGLVMVPKEDFGSRWPQEKMVRYEEALSRGAITRPADPSRHSLRFTPPGELLQPEGKIEGPTKIIGKEGLSPSRQETVSPQIQEVPAPKRASFREVEKTRAIDWNPDVRIAHRLGVSIIYDSRRNEVRCPQLGLSSRDIAFPRRMVSFPEGGFFQSGNPFISSSSGGSAPPSFSGGPERAAGSSGPAREGGSQGRAGEKK